jgi:hypothetical protein
MKKLLVVLIGLIVVVSAVSFARAETNIEQLRNANPFLVLDQLTAFSYGQLHEMYPALTDIELRSLMWRIVNHMQGLE